MTVFTKEKAMKANDSLTAGCANWISPLDRERLMEACRKVRHVALDMDGTISVSYTHLRAHET